MNETGKKDVIGLIETVFICVCLFGMLALILIATFARITGIASITWGEEAARYLMIWLAMISVSIGFKKDEHLGLSFFVERMSGKCKAIVLAIRAVVIMAFLLIVVFYGTRVILTQMNFIQYSPSLRIPMYCMYASIPVGFLLSALRFSVTSVSEIRACLRSE